MNPRYQVFLSSTFRDLQHERQAALEAILELGHFPAGMEAFPAADATPWELIRTIIAESDYYILIVGGKYGSTGPAGISYTEMEFDLAVELEKPILAFIHGAPEEIPIGRSELDFESRRRLDSFRSKVTQRLCKPWRNKDDLKAAVLLALVHAIRTKPAMGWIRNEGLDNQELLKRLANLQSRHDQLEEETRKLRTTTAEQADVAQYQPLEEQFQVRFRIGNGTAIKKLSVTWAEMFFGTADEMLIPSSESRLQAAMKDVLIEKIEGREDSADFGLPIGTPIQVRRSITQFSSSFKAITRQLMALGLIEPQLILRQVGDETGSDTTSDRCWVLTPAGRSKFLRKTAYLARSGDAD